MARKIPTHYVVRRPLTLFGKAREVGDIITRDEAVSLTRVEALVRSGRLDEQFTGLPNEETVDLEVASEPVVEKIELEEAPKPKKATAKKAVSQKETDEDA